MKAFFKDIYNRHPATTAVGILLLLVCFFSWFGYIFFANFYENKVQAEQGFLLTGSGTEQDPFIIDSVEDLYDFNSNVLQYSSTANSVKYTRLGCNIDLGGKAWHPIGTEEASGSFTGVFDGNGYTISNMNIVAGDYKYIGFFANIGKENSNSTIKNLNLSGVTIVASGSHETVGGLIGTSYAEIENCTVSATIDIKGYIYAVGGVVGMQWDKPIQNCTSYGNITATVAELQDNVRSTAYQYPRYGGVVGTLQQGSDSANLTNSMDINCSLAITPANYKQVVYVAIGGVIGQTWSSYNNTLINNGDINGVGAVGGIIGDYYSDGGIVENCTNNGNLYSTSGVNLIVGGIVSYCYREQNNIIKNCLNNGNITAESVGYESFNNTAWGGGIMGVGTATIENSASISDITFYGKNTHYVGGLVGGNNGVLRNSYCIGNIAVESATSIIIGGLVGIMQNKLEIILESCYYTGVVVGKLTNGYPEYSTRIGGIMGYNMRGSGTTIQNNYYNAKVPTGVFADSAWQTPTAWYGEDEEVEHYIGDLITNNCIIDAQTMQNDKLIGLQEYNKNNPTSSGVWVYNKGNYPKLYWQA